VLLPFVRTHGLGDKRDFPLVGRVLIRADPELGSVVAENPKNVRARRRWVKIAAKACAVVFPAVSFGKRTDEAIGDRRSIQNERGVMEQILHTLSA